jgi:Protein of unknown function (DUF1102).
MLGSLAAGGLGLVSTGAFSTVEASRTATVNTAGDANALLGIEPVEGKSEQYVNTTNGTVEIDIPNVNKNAKTTIDQLLEVTNNGTEKVTVGFVAEYAANKATSQVGKAAGGQSASIRVHIRDERRDRLMRRRLRWSCGQAQKKTEWIIHTPKSARN